MFYFESQLIELSAPAAMLLKVRRHLVNLNLLNFIKTTPPQKKDYADWSLTLEMDDYISLPKDLKI